MNGFYGSEDKLLLASHCVSLGLIHEQSIWDLLWTKWHKDRYFSKYLGFPCHYHSTKDPYSFYLPW